MEAGFRSAKAGGLICNATVTQETGRRKTNKTENKTFGAPLLARAGEPDDERQDGERGFPPSLPTVEVQLTRRSVSPTASFSAVPVLLAEGEKQHFPNSRSAFFPSPSREESDWQVVWVRTNATRCFAPGAEPEPRHGRWVQNMGMLKPW